MKVVRLTARSLPRIVRGLQFGDFLQLFRLYSTWSLLFQLAYYVFGVCVVHPSAITSMAVTSSLGGLVITYDAPRCVRFKTTDAVIRIDGAYVRALDVLFHHVPLFFWRRTATTLGKAITPRAVGEMCGVPLLWRACVDPQVVYGMDPWRQMVVVAGVVGSTLCLTY